MPESSRVRWSQLRIGLVALTAMIILAILIFLFTSRTGLFRRNVTLKTYMEDAAGMVPGTLVRLNGITIGELDALELTNSPDPKRSVEFNMLVQEKYLPDIPVDSVAGVAAANLLGGKFINITKGKSPEHVKPGAELRSLEAQDIPELMAEAAKILDSLQTISNRVDTMLAGVEAGKGNLGKLLNDEQLYDRLNAIAAEGQALLGDVRHGSGTISKLLYDDGLYKDLRAPLQRVDAMLKDLQNGQGTAGKLLKDPALFDEAHESLAEIHSLLADLNAGKGTAGKLLKDDEVYRRLDTLVAEFDATIDKINSGQGKIGQLLVNPQLYESLNSLTGELRGLTKDIRANPKKFLSLRLALF
jgi:phospholipid/cholesterol/gamma-HCH transport system substrate-binding protein